MAEDQNGDTFAPPHPNGAGHQSGITHARRVRRRLFVIGAVILLGAWIFAIVWSVTVTSSSPERLDADAALAVSNACSDTQHKLEALPNPFPRLGADRVARVRAENTLLRALVRSFDAVQPRSATPRSALRGWSVDWGRVIDARDRYATELAAAAGTDKTVKFVIPTASGVKPVTQKMDDFVRENHPDLDACFTRALELEVVELQRKYEKVTS